MSRRHKSGEVDSGSDSFLDIIANIVGILIILIVIAGVRISQLPPPAAAQKSKPAPPPEPVAVVEPVPEIVASLGDATHRPGGGLLPPEPPPVVVEKVPEPEPEPPRPPKPSPQLLADIALLDQEIDKLKQRTTATAQQRGESEKTARDTAAAAAEAAKKIDPVRANVEQLTAQLASHKKAMEDDMTHLALLANEIESRAADQPGVKSIVHRLTPVSKVVEGEEYHFRLLNNRVSHVPLDRLINQVKPQLLRRKSMLARGRSHQGFIGPVEGYRLRYLVEPQPLSITEELRYGSGMFRVAVTAWQLQVTSDLVTESAEEALQMGSRFVASLKNAPPDTTLTMWVYPDSFGLFRELQTVAHANGFNVAARPLPHGVPISGSPSGSRSAGQ